MRREHRHPAPACYERSVEVFDRDHPWSIRILGAVATGGATGATARWLVFAGFERFDATAGTDWPWALLSVNVVGAMLIGVAAGRLARDTLAWSFVATGVLGGFTTLSLLAVELNDLAERDRLPFAVVYAVVTIAAGWSSVAIGEWIARRRSGDGTPRIDGSSP